MGKDSELIYSENSDKGTGASKEDEAFEKSLKGLPEWAAEFVRRNKENPRFRNKNELEAAYEMQMRMQNPSYSPQGGINKTFRSQAAGYSKASYPYAVDRNIYYENYSNMPKMQETEAGRWLKNQADMTYMQKRADEPKVQEIKMSDAEVRRTADRVYRLLEDRIARELRRNGR